MSSVAEVPRSVVLAQRPGIVVVAVDERALLVERPSMGQQRLAGRAGGRGGLLGNRDGKNCRDQNHCVSEHASW